MKKTIWTTGVTLAAAVCLCPCTAAFAAEQILDLAPRETHIRYELDAGPHLVHGTFTLVSGAVHFDLETGEASGEIVIDARSGSSGSEGRDKRMHKKVLESDTFTTIIFTPEAVEGELVEGETRDLSLKGQLNIHGLSHPMTLPSEVRLEGGRVTARTRVSIPYVSWGMKDPSVLIFRAEKTTGVSIDLEGQLREAEVVGEIEEAEMEGALRAASKETGE